MCLSIVQDWYKRFLLLETKRSSVFSSGLESSGIDLHQVYVFLLKHAVSFKFVYVLKYQIIYLEYICLKTKPIANLPNDIPIVHNPDQRFYIQPLANQSVLIGGFLRESKPIFLNGVPDSFNYSLLPDNWDDFRELFFFKSIIDL
jgi:hypothetical protein